MGKCSYLMTRVQTVMRPAVGLEEGSRVVNICRAAKTADDSAILLQYLHHLTCCYTTQTRSVIPPAHSNARDTGQFSTFKTRQSAPSVVCQFSTLKTRQAAPGVIRQFSTLKTCQSAPGVVCQFSTLKTRQAAPSVVCQFSTLKTRQVWSAKEPLTGKHSVQLKYISALIPLFWHQPNNHTL